MAFVWSYHENRVPDIDYIIRENAFDAKKKQKRRAFGPNEVRRRDSLLSYLVTVRDSWLK